RFAASAASAASPSARCARGETARSLNLGIVRCLGAVCGVVSAAFEPMGQPAAVDVEGSQDLQDGLDRDVPLDGPVDDLQVFLTRFQAVEDAVDQHGLVVELAEEQAEVAAAQLDPEPPPLQVLQPSRPQVAPPVVAHPAADRLFAQVTARLLALDPLEPLGLPLAVVVDAVPLDAGRLSRF